MTIKKFFNLCLLLFLGIYSSGFAQKTALGAKNKSLHDVAFEHRQIFDNSCIPMCIEMVLKFNHRVSGNYYGLQNKWGNKMDGSFGNFDGKIISGLKFKHQFDIGRGDDFPYNRLFKTIDKELAAGRKVILSLPSGFNFWHIYVIDSKTKGDEYLAYSRFFDDKNLVTKADVKRCILDMKGTDILTYTIVD